MIHKFRAKGLDIGFDFDIDLQADQKIYCFIGKNGVGKTKLLETMAKSLFFCHSIFQKNDNRYQFGKRSYIKDVFEHLKDEIFSLPLEVDINGHTIKDKETKKWDDRIFENILNDQNLESICDKPIVFIGARNRGFVKNTDPNHFKLLSSFQDRLMESLTRTLSYIDGQGLEQEEIANWFISRLLINPNFVHANQDRSNEVLAVCQLIEKLEPDLKLLTKNDKGAYEISIIYHEGQLIFHGIPLDKLPSGFVAIIKIFQEIVAGYGGWFVDNKDLREVDGIVFIDEIEPHLHLSWQTKMIPLLKDFFPKTTFYISTHSPLVLAGLKNGEAYELFQEEKKVKAKQIKHIERYFINDIIQEYFNVDLNQIKIEKPNKKKQQEAKKKLLDLIQTIQEEK